jgi:hypothetical protein
LDTKERTDLPLRVMRGHAEFRKFRRGPDRPHPAVEAGSVRRPSDPTRAVVQQLQVDHDHRDPVRGIAPDSDRIEPIAHAATDEDSGCATRGVGNGREPGIAGFAYGGVDPVFIATKQCERLSLRSVVEAGRARVDTDSKDLAV